MYRDHVELSPRAMGRVSVKSGVGAPRAPQNIVFALAMMYRDPVVLKVGVVELLDAENGE